MNYLLRQSPDSIVTLAHDLDALTDNSDTVFTLRVIQALAIPDAQTTDIGLLQRVYIPLLSSRLSAMASAKKEFSRLSMGRKCLSNEHLGSAWLSHDETAIRRIYMQCQYASESMIAYAMDPAHTSSSYKTEAANLRHLHYIEAFLYGDDRYMREIMGHDASPKTKEALSKAFSAFPDTGDYFNEVESVLQGVGDLLQKGNYATLDSLAELLVEYANIKMPDTQFTQILLLLSLAHGQLYASASPKESLDWSSKLLEHIDVGLSEQVKTRLELNYRLGESIRAFIGLRDSMKKAGRTYANYLPYDCPPIVWALKEKGQNRYRESFLEALRDMMWFYSSGLTNREADQFDVIFRYAFDEYSDPVDMSLKAIPYTLEMADTIEDNKNGLILDILDSAVSILNQYNTTDPLIMIDLASAYYCWGMNAKSANLLEQHIISNLKLLSYPTYDQNQLCDDLYLSMRAAGLMRAMKMDKPVIINQLENDYLSHIQEVEDTVNRAYLNINYGNYLFESERYNEACVIFNNSLSYKLDRPALQAIKSCLVQCYNAQGYYKQAITIGEELEQEKFVSDLQYDARLLNSMIKGGSSALSVQAKMKKYLSNARQFISSFLLEFSSENRLQLMETIRRSHIVIPISTNREDISPLLSSLQYDWALFTKTLLLKTDKTIDKYLSHHPDYAVRERFSQWQHLCGEVDKLAMENGSAADVSYIQFQKYFAEKDLGSVIRSGNIPLNSMSRYLSISWKDVQKKLKKNEVALEIIHAPDNSYYALLIRPGFKAPKYVHLCYASELQKGSLKERRIYNNRIASIELYKSIWGPLEEYIKDADRVYFSIDGELHRFNLESFYSEDGVLASDKFNLCRLSSTGELCFPHSEELQTALLWGGLEYNLPGAFMVDYFDKPGERNWVNLPQTMEEVDSIASLLSQTMRSVRVLSGPDGDESSFKSLSSQGSNLIVFSTHGFYSLVPSSLDPMLRSGIVFSRSPGQSVPEDGLLYAKEIATYNLSDVSLVIMSACQTALGDISPDGVFGLQRGFKMAGVGGIVMTLWEVNSEESRDFMFDFFEGITRGQDRHQSFQKARQNLKSKHPLGDWAAFIMVD